jgi:hypothetical protein
MLKNSEMILVGDEASEGHVRFWQDDEAIRPNDLAHVALPRSMRAKWFGIHNNILLGRAQ